MEKLAIADFWMPTFPLERVSTVLLFLYFLVKKAVYYEMFDVKKY